MTSSAISISLAVFLGTKLAYNRLTVATGVALLSAAIVYHYVKSRQSHAEQEHSEEEQGDNEDDAFLEACNGQLFEELSCLRESFYEKSEGKPIEELMELRLKIMNAYHGFVHSLSTKEDQERLKVLMAVRSQKVNQRLGEYVARHKEEQRKKGITVSSSFVFPNGPSSNDPKNDSRVNFFV